MRGSGAVLRVTVLAVAAATVALGVSACGKKKSSPAQASPVTNALKAPGVRTVVIPEQHEDITIVVPPCSAAQSQQPDIKEAPPGSNQIIVPKGTLTQTVAVQPCVGQTEGGTNAVLVSPGGAQQSQQTDQQTQSLQNQLVLPENSKIETIIVPPCTEAKGTSGTEEQPPGSGNALPADKKSVTAPPCIVPPEALSSSSSSGG